MSLPNKTISTPCSTPQLYTNNPQPPTSPPSCHPSISPLDIPEILERIFSYLTSNTITTNVALVCRQWFLINQHHLYRDVHWDEAWKPAQPKQALARLPGAKRLVLRSSRVQSKWRGPDLHAALVALQTPPSPNCWSTLTSLLWPQDNQTTLITDVLYQPLQEIDLILTNSFPDTWLDHLPFPPTLTKLSVNKTGWASCDVTRILVKCPHLKSLHLLSDRALYFAGPWTEQGTKALPERMPLRSLVLRHPFVTQSWIEHLLMATPHLEKLELLSICTTMDDVWDWPRFSSHLQSLALPLKRFHYSIPWAFTVNDRQEKEILETCRLAQERTLLTCYLTPRVLRCLEEQPTVLTTLDIRFVGDVYCHQNGWQRNHLDVGTRYTAQPWHQLLCECDNLRHLRTLKMPYMVEFMDLHRRIDMYERSVDHRRSLSDYHYQLQQQQEDVPPIVPGIWICRELEILELDIHIHRHGPEKASHYMRILYGYISLLCPRLQDLNITFEKFCQFQGRVANWSHYPYNLEAGLCLLSRLKYLERLAVRFWPAWGFPAEMNWLCQTGHTEFDKYLRQLIINNFWKSKLETEVVIEAARATKHINSGVTNDILGADNADEELVASLRNLGLLQEVKEKVVEMDTDEFICLPELRWLAYSHHLAQPTEKEFQSLYYCEPPSLTAKLRRWWPIRQ